MQANQDLVERTQYKVKDLPVGEKMLFRVVAINIAGRSPPATLPQAVTIREIMGPRAVSPSLPNSDSFKTNVHVHCLTQSIRRSASLGI